MKSKHARSLYFLIATLALSQACAGSASDNCDEDSRRCNDNNIEICQDNTWTVSIECGSDICTSDNQGNLFCSSTDCLDKCANGILYSCQPDGTSTINNCIAQDMICGILDDGTPACVDKSKSCQSICKDGLLTNCHEDGSVSTQNCAKQNKICGILDDGTLTCAEPQQTCQSTCKNNTPSLCQKDGSIITENCANQDKICGYDADGNPTCVDDPNQKSCNYNDNTLQADQSVCDSEGNVVTCLSDGTLKTAPCEHGVCVDGDCQLRDCDDIKDGQNTCKDLKLMVCNDGTLVDAIPGCDAKSLCRDGQTQCSPYENCDTITHDENGCSEGNIANCNDGNLSIIEDCVKNDQFCAASTEDATGFICKYPDPTDCEWKGALIEKGKTVCDENLLRTCSAKINTEFDEGLDCEDIDPNKPICDETACREEMNCGATSEITPGSIVCNEAGTNKATCIDGQLVDFTDTDACSARENATPVCTFTTEAKCSDICNTGYKDINGVCEIIKTCDSIKETYDEATNTCACNTANHWAGTAGSCACETGYVLIGGNCELKKTCDAAKETYVSATNACACNESAHYTGKSGSCECQTGYYEISNQCKAGCYYNNSEYQYGNSVCSSEGKVLTCQKDGTMKTETCSVGVCFEGKCVSRGCGELKDGDYQCQSGSLMVCNDGTLNAAPVPCTSNQLCLEGKSACVDKKSCTATGSILDTEINDCICNTNKGWVGNGTSCSCKAGNVPVNGKCVLKATCDPDKEIYLAATNSCECDYANHFVGDAGTCACENGYVLISDTCELKKTCDSQKETYQTATNTCKCDYSKHFVGAAGSCSCENGYVLINNTCELKKTCDSVKEIYNSTTNTCSCNTANHWTGTAGSCTCDSGYVLIGGKCEAKKSCDATKETYVSATNSCACNTANHWTGTAGSCTCDTGYVLIGGKCEAKKSCDSVKETYNSTTNTCSCNTSNHWAGTAGSCTCDSSYVLIGGKCEAKKACDSVKETYVSATNSCACNTANHWAGTAGSCTCDTGYVLIGGKCEAKKSCDSVKETYNSTTNTCSCNTSNHWAGTAGSCTCATGYYLDDSTCKADDAKHCRGVDCTAISYWGDGICSADGQCQPTSCVGDTHLYNNGTTQTCEANTAEHCGTHDTACKSGQSCVDGACSNIMVCNGVSVDTNTDIDNCGECDNACAYGHTCINGKCLGSTICKGANHDTTTDLDHCGECDNRCADGTTCLDGECVIGDGPTYCGSKTVKLNSAEHCDSCEPCADGLICQNNKCISGQGEMICNNIVVDSTSDSANCGSCGKVCKAGFGCVNSVCKRIDDLSTATITCNANSVKPYYDHDNCTGCKIACSSSTFCKQGVCTKFAVGDIIYFGYYEQDNDTSNGKEPIEWRVLAISGSKTLLISEKTLDVNPYNTTNISITWAKSTIRSWLNGYGASTNTVGTNYSSDNFIDTAFTTEEKAKIVNSSVPAHNNPSYTSIDPGSATTDKIFLLSIYEAQTYFSSNTDRLADATRYAVKKGAGVKGSSSGKYTSDGTCTDVHCYSIWWLRSPSFYYYAFSAYHAANVIDDGSIYNVGVSVDLVEVAVRPALWVNLQSLIF